MLRLMLGLVCVQLMACAGDVEPEPAPPAALVDGADCDPTREVCRRTLACGYEVSDGLDLATGVVVALGGTAPRRDLMCSIGRFVGLQSAAAIDGAGIICPVSAGFEPELFDAVEDIPGDASVCTWRTNLLCGVDASPFAPACRGFGVLVRDAEQLYRLRIETDLIDRADAQRARVTFDYTAVDP